MSRELQKESPLRKAIRQQDDQDLLRILQSDHGRRFVWRIFAECGVFDEIPVTSAESAYRLGKRKVGLWLAAIVQEIQPDAMWRMAVEAHRQGEELKAVEEKA